MNIQQAANLGGFITLGGRELHFTPLCLNDYGLAQAHLKTHTRNPLEGIEETANKLHPEVAKVLINRAYDAYEKWGSLDTEEGKRWCASADGLAFFAFQMTRRHHPDVTMEWLKEECAKLENEMLSEIFTKVAEISSLQKNPPTRVKRKPPGKRKK